MVKRWIPLEANPDVLNDFAKGWANQLSAKNAWRLACAHIEGCQCRLGLDTSKFQFCDVYGLDEVGKPCCTHAY